MTRPDFFDIQPAPVSFFDSAVKEFDQVEVVPRDCTYCLYASREDMHNAGRLWCTHGESMSRSSSYGQYCSDCRDEMAGWCGTEARMFERDSISNLRERKVLFNV